MMSRPLARFCALAAIAAFTMGAESRCSAGFGDFPGDPIDNVDDGSGNGDHFVTTLRLRNSSGTETYQFRRGELITFELTVRNRTAETQTVDLATTLTADYLVFPDGEETWTWAFSENKAFPTVITPLTFAPEETKVVSFTWNQLLADGTTLARGYYDTRGLLAAVGVHADPDSPHELRSVLRQFRVN